MVLLVLLILVIVSCSSLIVVNYYTIKTMSAIRAFINGESIYSKAQKDGTRNLLFYLNQRHESQYKNYNKNFQINLGDSLALHGLSNGAQDRQILNNLIRGRNDPGDAADMIWLVKNFGNFSFLRDIIHYWRLADAGINDMHRIATSAHERINSGTYFSANEFDDTIELNYLDDLLTQNELHFSDTLDEASRQMRQYLITADILMVLLIVGFNCIYSGITIKRLSNLARILEVKNTILIDTNLELDRFVYSASHDLRAPITSLKGLLAIIKEEDNLAVIREYHQLMDLSLDQQDTFIREIINYSRNKRTELNIEPVNLSELVSASISQHQFIGESVKISFTADPGSEIILSDPLRLKIIINNLISNAVKFSDKGKAQQQINISCRIVMNTLKIAVEDNGVGIEEQHRSKIFDMFFVTTHSNRGSGLGLYITLETINKLGGKVDLVSEKGIGSCFTVSIPLVIKEFGRRA